MVRPGRRTEPVSAQAQTERGKEGRRGRPERLGIRSSPRCPGPQARAARQSAAHRQQIRWGLPAGREADYSVPRRPSRPRKEVTRALRTPARRLRWGGGWLRATWARGGCGSWPELPTMVWRRGRRRGPEAAGGDGRRQPSAQPGPPGPDADPGAGARKQVRVAANSPNLLRGWPLRAAGWRGAPSRPGRGAQGRVPFIS
nr:collagen alpha-1(I) chain-like [Equus asinus]